MLAELHEEAFSAPVFLTRYACIDKEREREREKEKEKERDRESDEPYKTPMWSWYVVSLLCD